MILFPLNRSYHKKKPPAVAPLQGPVLIATDYDPGEATVTLFFDRAINLSLFDPAQIFVKDGIATNQKLQGYSHETTSPESVLVILEQIDSYSGPSALLDTVASAGIKSAANNVPWIGVTDYVLTIV